MITHTDTRPTTQTVLPSGIAVGLGALAVITAVWTYWLIVPGAVFGVLAVVLGVRGHRSGNRTHGAVAISLGIAALFLVPSVLVVVDDAEDWGRSCALNPSNPDC